MGTRMRALVQIILQCKILCYQYGLTVLLDHMEVIGRVYAALEQNTVVAVRRS